MNTTERLILDLAVIIVVARLFGAAARRLGQPAVIGETLAGILLGPTLFHGAITSALFPTSVRPSLQLIANIGVCVFMFLVGLELDSRLLSGQSRLATTVSLTSMVLPFALGVLVAFPLLADHPTSHRLGFVLFLGTAMSVTAFPVLARILTDRGLIRTPIGGIALAVAAIDDVLAWTLLVVVAALVGAGSHPVLLLLVPPYAVAMVWGVRPLLAKWAARQDRREATGWMTDVSVLLIVSLGLWLSAEVTNRLGLHVFFGAFLFGCILPREGAAALRRRVLPWVERGCFWLLLPVFFIVSGIKVNLSSMTAAMYGELALILLVAIGGKFGGAYLGARLSGVRQRHAVVLAALINTRGLTELIVLSLGLQLAVLDQRLYSLMVVMALITTALAGVLLRFVYPDELVRADSAELDRADSAGVGR